MASMDLSTPHLGALHRRKQKRTKDLRTTEANGRSGSISGLVILRSDIEMMATSMTTTTTTTRSMKKTSTIARKATMTMDDESREDVPTAHLVPVPPDLNDILHSPSL